MKITEKEHTISTFDVNRIVMSFFLTVFACLPAASLRVKLHSIHVVENMLQKRKKNVRCMFLRTYTPSRLYSTLCIVSIHRAHTIEPI